MDRSFQETNVVLSICRCEKVASVLFISKIRRRKKTRNENSYCTLLIYECMSRPMIGLSPKFRQTMCCFRTLALVLLFIFFTELPRRSRRVPFVLGLLLRVSFWVISRICEFLRRCDLGFERYTTNTRDQLACQCA